MHIKQWVLIGLYITGWNGVATGVDHNQVFILCDLNLVSLDLLHDYDARLILISACHLQGPGRFDIAASRLAVSCAA